MTTTGDSNKEKLDQYDRALRAAILRDGVSLRSLTAWKLRHLQFTLNLGDHQVIPPEALRSELKINYIPLWRRLEASQWQEANQITQELILEAALQNRTRHSSPAPTGKRQQADQPSHETVPQLTRQLGSIGLSQLKNFPCVDLLTINYLWSWFSGGQFGFSVQNQIWHWLDADLDEFAHRIGWLTTAGWIASNQLQSLPEAKRGHLPFLQPILQPVNPQDLQPYTQACLKALLQRLESCPIRLAS